MYAILSYRLLEAVASVSMMFLPVLRLPCAVLHVCVDYGDVAPATCQDLKCEACTHAVLIQVHQACVSKCPN